jgi:hypothetical protein
MVGDVSNSNISKALQWIKESGLLAVTVVGLLIYFVLSIPATLFYTRLGTSPGEVGLNYANLLSGSTFELLVIFILLAGAVILGGFLIVYFTILLVNFVPSPRSRQGRRKASPKERFDQLLDHNLKLYKRMPEFLASRIIFQPEFPKSLTELETIMKRREELLKTQNLTPEQSAELASTESRLRHRRGFMAVLKEIYMRPFVTYYLGIRYRIRGLIISFALVIAIVILPALAFIQSGEVLDGHEYFASNTGIFDYGVNLVNVRPAATNSTPEIQSLAKEKLFLLGENAQYAVLYSPTKQSTIRVPIAAVVISSLPS